MTSLILTNHAKDRIRERHDRHLQRYETLQEFNAACYELLKQSEASRRHLNDSNLMVFIHEKYGYDRRYSFRIFKNVLFVVIDERTVVTVIDTNTYSQSPRRGYSRQFGTVAAPASVSPQRKRPHSERPGRKFYEAVKRHEDSKYKDDGL